MVYQFYTMALYHSQTRRHVIFKIKFPFERRKGLPSFQTKFDPVEIMPKTIQKERNMLKTTHPKPEYKSRQSTSKFT